MVNDVPNRDTHPLATAGLDEMQRSFSSRLLRGGGVKPKTTSSVDLARVGLITARSRAPHSAARNAHVAGGGGAHEGTVGAAIDDEIMALWFAGDRVVDGRMQRRVGGRCP